MGKLRLVTGDVDPANLVVVNRVSHVEAYQVNYNPECRQHLPGQIELRWNSVWLFKIQCLLSSGDGDTKPES